MANSKPRTETAPAALQGPWREVPWIAFAIRFRRPLLALAVCLALALGARRLWTEVGPHVVADERFSLRAEDISVTPPPDWVKGDVVHEAIRDASLDGPLSILDDDLCQRLAKAFAMHPWVAKVDRVQKRAGPAVQAVLAYRRPVCMVEVPDGKAKVGLFPIDAEGVLLPADGFAPREAAAYPRLGGIPPGAWGAVGARGRDANIAAGAALAEVLFEAWPSLGLERFFPERGPAGAVLFVIETKRGDRVIWGSSPGRESGSEPPAADKLARLQQLLGEPGAGPASAGQLDLRTETQGEIQAAKQPRRS